MRFSDWSSDVCSSDLGVIGYVPQALEFDRGLPMTVDDFMAAMCQRRPAFLGLSKHYVSAIGQALEGVGMQELGRAAGRGREWELGSIPVGAGTLTKTTNSKNSHTRHALKQRTQ